MFITYFLKFLQLFSKNYRYKLVVLTILSVICGFLEFLGVAVVFPLIIIMLAPDKVHNFAFLNRYEIFQNDSIMLYLGGIIVFAFLVKNIMMIYKSYYQFDFLKDWQTALNLSVFKKYLYSSYETVLHMPEKYSIFQVWNLSAIVFNQFITMVLNLLSNLIILSIVSIFLLYKFGFWGIVTGAFFLLSGLMQNKFFKNKGRSLTQQKVKIMEYTNNSFFSAIKSFKDIKIFAKENYFYNLYKKHMKKVGKVETLINFFNSIPQNIVEISVIFSIVIMCYGIVLTSGDSSETMVASFSLLAAAMFRMAPIINKLQSNLNMINMSKPAIVAFFDAYSFYNDIACDEKNENLFEFNENIVLKDLVYRYSDSKVLDNLNLEIKKGEFIGIIGKSGVGKTTFLDVLMGVLNSYQGELFVDNKNLKEGFVKNWMELIGYVPQEITVLPVSIAENIAFGVDENNIDYERLSKSVADAQLEDFIFGLQNGIKEKMNNISGLSVGQKQRLGLARALYKNPQILFLDEITASLDLETENKIVQCLNSLKGEKTIIAIAHRLSTLKNCDRILFFKSSSEVLSGSFSELMTEDEEFRTLVNFASVDNIINS